MKNISKILLVLAISTLFTTQSFAEKKVKWKLAMTWPKTLAPLSTPPQRVAELVKEMTNGQFTIKVHGKGIHKAPLAILDLVKNNHYEIGHSSSYYYKGVDIATAPFTTMPFGLTTTEQYAWYYYGGGKELAKKVYDKFNVDLYPGGNTGVQMGGWFKKEINSLEDLKGLKIRIAGMAGEIFSELNANVTNIPGGELYTALDRGTIDAVEWVGPGMDIRMGFHKIAPYYYTGWQEPASEMHFFVNQKAFKKLSKVNQSILKVAIKLATSEMHTAAYNQNVVAWEQMKKEFPNIKVKTFPQDVLQAMKTINDTIMEKYSKENTLFKEIYQSQQSYLKQAREWTKISEYNYINTTNSVK
jgi:TRAP-type mannitol/chloroaromatic compound transport system substrate-binding protein